MGPIECALRDVKPNQYDILLGWNSIAPNNQQRNIWKVPQAFDFTIEVEKDLIRRGVWDDYYTTLTPPQYWAPELLSEAIEAATEFGL